MNLTKEVRVEIGGLRVTKEFVLSLRWRKYTLGGTEDTLLRWEK